MRLRSTVALCISSLICSLAQAGESDALASIPGEAVGFICIPNPEELDQDIKKAIEKLGFSGMVPLPGNSVLTLAQAQVPALKGMDADQPLIVAIMPGDDPTEMDETQVVMIPTEDSKAMLNKLDGSESDGAWSVKVMGKSLVADTRDGYVLLADRKEILDDVESSEQAMDKVMMAKVAAGMSDQDLVVGLNVSALSGVIEPWLEDNFYPMMEAQAKTDLQKEQMKLQRKQFGRLLEGLRTMLVGLRMEDDGLAFRIALGAKEGTELADSMYVAVTDRPLLEGLSGGNWALAGGQVMDAKQAKVQAENLNEMFETYESIDGIDQEKLSELKGKLNAWIKNCRGYRMSLSPSPEGADGVFTTTVIASAEDGKDWMKLTGETFTLAKDLLGDLDEDVSKVLSAVSMQEQGELIDFAIDLSKVDQIDEDQQEMIENIVGADTTIHMKPMSDTEVMITFGAEAAGGSSDAESTAINALSDFLPAERNSVNYIFVDQAIEVARKVLIAIDEDDLPFATPEIDEPIAMTATGGENWSMVDFVIPMEVIQAGRDIGMTMMGRQ